MKRNDSEYYDKAKETINMNNLSILIKKHNYTITKVSMNTGINDATLYKYLNNTLTPSLPNLITLADYFKVNLDYLIGRAMSPAMYDIYNSEEVDAIIRMVNLLTIDDRRLVNSLIQTIVNEREKQKELDSLRKEYSTNR